MENNPLKQYFRRPAVYLRLPSTGKDYSSDILTIPENGELPIYPMTAIDEITARTPDALFNGAAVVELIKSCVPNIKNPWGINSNDLDSVLIAIRAASGNDAFEIESECPECKEITSYNVNLAGVLASIKPADYSTVLTRGDLKIKFRPLTYKEMNEGALGQFEIQKTLNNIMAMTIDDSSEEMIKNREEMLHNAIEKTTYLTMTLLSEAIEYIETPHAKVNEKEFIYDFLTNCEKKVYDDVREFNTKLKSESELKPLDVKCNNCGHSYKQSYTLNPTDFFG